MSRGNKIYILTSSLFILSFDRTLHPSTTIGTELVTTTSLHCNFETYRPKPTQILPRVPFHSAIQTIILYFFLSIPPSALHKFAFDKTTLINTHQP